MHRDNALIEKQKELREMQTVIRWYAIFRLHLKYIYVLIVILYSFHDRFSIFIINCNFLLNYS